MTEELRINIRQAALEKDWDLLASCIAGHMILMKKQGEERSITFKDRAEDVPLLVVAQQEEDKFQVWKSKNPAESQTFTQDETGLTKFQDYLNSVANPERVEWWKRGF